MRFVLAGFLLLLPWLAKAQTTVRGIVRDSLTQKPLPFASVFLANTTLGGTTNEQGQFVLANVPPGTYDIVASYVGYRLAKQPLAVGTTPQQLTLTLAPETNQLAEVVVRARRHTNRPADYQRFAQLLLGRTSFSQQCRIRNPQAVVVDYETKTKQLTASTIDFLEIENQALGYRLKYYGLHFAADFTHQVVQFYGQPVFEELTPHNAHQRQRWAANRATAYHGSLTHFLKSVFDNQVATEGFVARKVRIVPNPPFARADSLRQQLLRRRRQSALTAAEQDSLVRWAKVMPSLLLLYTTPRPIDSLRRVTADGRVFLRFSDCLQVTYLREVPDPLYPGPPDETVAPGPAQQVSRLQLLQREAELQPNGQLLDPMALFTENYWGFEKMGEFLPVNYSPPLPTHDN